LEISPPVKLAAGVSEEYVRGVGRVNDRLIVILEATKVFTPRVAEQLANLADAAPATEADTE